MKDDYTVQSVTEQYMYNGNVSKELLSRALDAFRTYKSDKTSLVNRIKDNERFYRESYDRFTGNINAQMKCDTPFIFSAIENARSDAVENFPSPNILERSAEGSQIADTLTKIIPAQLEISGFKRVYKDNARNKYKYGTGIYGVFYNDIDRSIDINAIDILDIYVDMHLSDPQDSQFMFISAAIDNDVLREAYPEFAALFTGDTTIETLTDDYQMKDRSSVLDCYYKTAEGAVHMMKLCKNTVIAATEDMPGYENGLYNHGMYPVVFDVLYPVEHCPFGFGMIDIGKSTQIAINKTDDAITENVIVNSKPRYLSKRSGGIDEAEFKDLSKNIVHYEGDTDALKPIESTPINEFALTHREHKKDELKELLANRDFQQGATSGGVTAASAIEALQQAGEKRSRAIVDDTYDSFETIVYMIIELMRQFYDDKRTFRISDEMGQKQFAEFSNAQMYTPKYTISGTQWEPIEFDIDVVPQRENPYTRETANNTILTLWQSGLLAPQNFDVSKLALKNMNFDGKDKLIRDMQELQQQMAQQQQQMMMAQQQTVPMDQQVVSGSIDENAMQQARAAQMQTMEQMPVDIAGGGENAYYS